MTGSNIGASDNTGQAGALSQSNIQEIVVNQSFKTVVVNGNATTSGQVEAVEGNANVEQEANDESPSVSVFLHSICTLKLISKSILFNSIFTDIK